MTETANDSTVIEMRGVTAGSMKDPALTVAEGVDWTVKAGEFWVVAGAQRSGKTDFLMMAGGLMGPVTGTYRLYGEEMPIFEDDRLAERLRLGVVFDGGQLFNRLTIAENVALPLRYHRGHDRENARAKTQALLTATNLKDLGDSRPTMLGRSLQKQAGLARALALGPEVLLLDNPLSGVGPRHGIWWLRFLNDLVSGHELMGGKPMTIIATADDLRPWNGGRQQFALLSKNRFTVLGGWPEVDRSRDNAVQYLLRDRPIEKNEKEDPLSPTK